MIEILLKHTYLNAIGFAGRKFNFSNEKLYYFGGDTWPLKISEIKSVDFLETYHGVLYKRY